MPSHRIPKLFKDNQSNIEKTLANVHMDMLLCIHKVETEKNNQQAFHKRFIGTCNYLVCTVEAVSRIGGTGKATTHRLQGLLWLKSSVLYWVQPPIVNAAAAKRKREETQRQEMFMAQLTERKAKSVSGGFTHQE
jgi:hypothetical protein